MAFLFRLDCQHPNFTPLNITEEPIGFDSIKLTTKRNERYDGMLGEFAFDLRFCNDGADYINSVFAQLGVLASSYFYIHIHRNSRSSENLLLTGKILLTTYNRTADGVSISIVPADDTMDFINLMETEVDLFSKTKLGGTTETLADLPTVDTTVISTELAYVTSYKVNADELVACYEQINLYEWADYSTGEPYEYVQFMSKMCPVLVYDDLLIDNADNTGNGNFPLVTCGFSGMVDVCVTGEWLAGMSAYLIFPPPPVDNIGVYFEIACQLKQNDTTLATFGYILSTDPNDLRSTASMVSCGDVSTFTTTITAAYTATVPVTFGDTFSLQVFFKIRGYNEFLTDKHIQFVAKLESTANCNISFKRAIQEDSTISKTLFAKDAFQRITSLISSKTVESDTFSYDVPTNTYGSSGNVTLCNGLMLRNAALTDPLSAPDTCFVADLPNEAARWVMNFNKLFDNLNSIFCLGMDFTANTVRIERKAYFYKYELALSRLYINERESKFVMTFNEREVYNKFMFGYSNYDDKYYSLREDIHTEREYANKATQYDKSFEQKCEFIASPQTITRQMIADSSDNANFDSETFVMTVWKFEPSNELTTNYVSSGTYFPYSTQINFAISPQMNWQRWARYITRVTLQGQPATLTKGTGYVTSTYGVDLIPLYSINQLLTEDRELYALGTTLTENDPLPCNDAMRLFLPFEYSFETQMCFEDYQTLRANPYSIIEFQLDSTKEVYQGWINQMDYNPNTSIIELKLIAANPLYYKNA